MYIGRQLFALEDNVANNVAAFARILIIQQRKCEFNSRTMKKWQEYRNYMIVDQY